MPSTQEYIQDLYQKAILFASVKHLDQKIPGTNLPYMVHMSNVAMEIIVAASNSPDFDLYFAVQVALLHDTLEDTSTTFDELEMHFGLKTALAVSALSKNESLPKGKRMHDSLQRIKLLQKEVWAVKLADRITNLQPPPGDWDKTKRHRYLEEAKMILKELKGGNAYLEKRLEEKIGGYGKFI